MADKPVLFSGPMVRALLAGTKTQTRRTPKILQQAYVAHDNRQSDNPAMLPGMRYWNVSGAVGGRIMLEPDFLRLLPWHVGDRLYVRETWTHTGTGVWTVADTHRAIDGAVAYQADGSIPGGKYWPSIHMPRRYSRITLTVTDVRVEWLQDISEADAQAEGIERMKDFFGCPCWKDYTDYGDSEPAVCPDDPVGSYHSLWDSINGAGAWEANPWVAAYTFTVERGNIDQLAGAA